MDGWMDDVTGCVLIGIGSLFVLCMCLLGWWFAFGFACMDGC